MKAQSFLALIQTASCAAIAGCAAAPPVPMRVPPEASLSIKGGRIVGRHYGGPTWEANDGRRLIGEALASSASTKPNSIPWPRLRAKAPAGNGLLTHVWYIQRLNTAGGSVPATGCGKALAGPQLRAAYKADYSFYGARQ